MKLGNISQTIVEVPKFFFDKTKDIDAFKSEYNDISTIKSSSRYFSFKKVKNILNSNLDINLNNNPRLMRISDKINKYTACQAFFFKTSGAPILGLDSTVYIW